MRERVFSVDRSRGYTRKERAVEVIVFRRGRAEQVRRGLGCADRELAFQKVSAASSEVEKPADHNTVLPPCHTLITTVRFSIL